MKNGCFNAAADKKLMTKTPMTSTEHELQEPSPELIVRRLFVFLRDNVIYESIKDDIRQACILSEKEEDVYVCEKPCRQIICERLIKHIIKEKKCRVFIDLMKGKCCHVSKKIREACEQIQEEDKKDDIQRIPFFKVTDERLKKHLACLHIELEPREIVDEMFQAGDISARDHDAVTDPNRKYKRVKELLQMLKNKKLHPHFILALQSLKYEEVLQTLHNDRKVTKESSQCAVCIQQSFCLLKEELPGTKDAKIMVDQMYFFLDDTNISDIDYFTSARQQTSKLLKILLMKGNDACTELFRVIEGDLRREDLISKMTEKNEELKQRGMPVLNQKLRSLKITCLDEHKDFLLEELEPLDLCDLLFEERAIDIPDHDRITETKKILKQVRYLLEIVKKNENECFLFFLYILNNNGYSVILEELEKSDSEVARETKLNTKFEWRASHILNTVSSDDIQNRSINIKLTMESSEGKQIEQALHQQVNTTYADFHEEVITHSQMYIEDICTGSVVIKLRPVTDQAVQTLLNAQKNNRLLELILGIIKRVDVPNIQDIEELEVKVQVSYTHSAKTEPDISRTEQIKERIKVNRNELISELELRTLTSVLSKSDCFEQGTMDSLRNSPTSFHQRKEKLLSLIENGDTRTVETFVSALKNAGYSEIVELIDPKDIHSKAEKIRKGITSNYKTILDEMQLTIAKETLSACIGGVDAVRQKILPKNGKRRQRMAIFLQFILQEDHNVIQFEKTLRNNGLEDLLQINADIQEEHVAMQDIEIKIAEDPTNLYEGILFESVVNLSLSGKEQTYGKRKHTERDKLPGEPGEKKISQRNNEESPFKSDPCKSNTVAELEEIDSSVEKNMPMKIEKAEFEKMESPVEKIMPIKSDKRFQSSILQRPDTYLCKDLCNLALSQTKWSILVSILMSETYSLSLSSPWEEKLTKLQSAFPSLIYESRKLESDITELIDIYKVLQKENNTVRFISDDVRHQVMSYFLENCLITDEDYEKYFKMSSVDSLMEYVRPSWYKHEDQYNDLEKCLFLPESLEESFIQRLGIDVLRHIMVDHTSYDSENKVDAVRKTVQEKLKLPLVFSASVIEMALWNIRRKFQKKNKLLSSL